MDKDTSADLSQLIKEAGKPVIDMTCIKSFAANSLHPVYQANACDSRIAAGESETLYHFVEQLVESWLIGFEAALQATGVPALKAVLPRQYYGNVVVVSSPVVKHLIQVEVACVWKLMTELANQLGMVANAIFPEVATIAMKYSSDEAASRHSMRGYIGNVVKRLNNIGHPWESIVTAIMLGEGTDFLKPLLIKLEKETA